MKIIINRIIQELEKVSMIGRDIRFGVSQFSDDVQDEVLLKQNFKKNELLRYLKREFVQKHGQRNSSRALEHAHDVLFQQVSGSRRLMGYPQFLVVFIGGKSQDEFRHAVEMVKYLGVKIIAVGIQDYDAAELNLISKQQFIQKQNPQLFQDIANAIQGELKNPFISGEKPSACKQATADIVFLVDYTDDIGEGNFLQLQKFFYEVFSSFSISKDGVRIGLSMLSETRNAGFHLSRYNSQAEILQHVKDLQYTRGTGRPASTTKSIEELFSQQNGGRAELFVPQIAVFVTNNGSWNDIKEMADKLHSSNVDTFAVGVGVAHEKKLSIISSYPPHNFILSADTFLQLASSLQETFIKRLCLFLLGHQLPRNMDVLRDGCVNTEEIDVYFMIDGSGSISREQFRKIKGFLSQMADIFKVTPEGVRIGVVQYSTDVVTEFHLGQYNSARDLKLAISDIKQQKKKTFTGKALSHMTRLFLQSASNRPSAQQYLIVLTDGKSDDEVSIPAEELRNMTVHIYAIGVGDAVVSELNEIAGRTDRYFHINNCHFLDDIKEELIEEICLPAASKHKEADMVFLIHSSTSSSHFKFEQVKEFMEEFLQQFTISEDKVRIAVMQYSDTVKHEFGFDANIGEEAVLNAINVMQPFQGTETKTGHALSSMSEIFRSDSTREYVDKVLIVVTDEKSTDSVQKPARDLRKEGINIISIGSSRADIEQLVDISGSTESSFYVENYVKVPLESMTFTANVQENDCKSISVADVVFVVDTSSSIDSTEFKSMIDFMLSVVNSSDVGPESVHFGVSLYSDDAQKAFGLQDHLTRESLVKAISDLKPRYGNTYTAKAIKFSKDLLSESEGGRGHQKVPQFLITITDGDSNDHDDLESVCDTVRASSINTIAVGIDEAIKSELDMIAGSEDNQFYVKTFDKLKNVKNILTKKLCQDKYCPCQEIDVIFLIDGSESIDKDSDFPIIKHFVKNITQSLDVCKYSRVGLAQYSQDFEMYFEMSHFCQMSEFNNKVDAVQQLEQGTWTAKALKEARKFVTPDKKRGGIQPRLILMTDGKSKDSDEISKNAADLREKDKVEILVVAVGDKKNIKYEKLRQIAGKDSNVFNVRGYEELRRLKRSIIPNICDEEKCKKPNDCQIDVAVGIDFTQMHGTALFSAHFQLKRNLLPILKSINSLLQTSCTSDIHIRFGFNIDNTPVKPNSTFQDLTFFEDRDYFKGLGQILQASGLNRQYLRSFGETFALESSTTAQQVILIFTDGLDDDKEILKRESDQLITEGVDGLITVALEGTGDIQDLQSIEFGRGYRYRPQLVIGDKTAAHLYTAFDNLAEEKCCDCCKCTGPQGSEGDPGRPGDKGEKGQKGGSGFPGEEGPPGVPGSPGSQGPTGDRGCNGQSGLKGSYGYTGEKGDPGDDGWDGISGPEGDEGDPGLKGEKGNEGNPGIPGVPGQPGGKGEKGLTGDPGQPGLDSYTPGEKGETGPTGREGNPGSKGRDGPRGDPGRDGLNGQRGPPGAQGSQGPPGDNGSKGENGSRGKQGPRGQPGEKGLPGDSGIKGPQGAQGPPGGKGSKGGQGTRGQKGQPGDPGVKGDIGSQGFRGQPGFNGRDRYGGKGQKGYKGDRGCQGHQGAQGQIGDKGSEGQKGHKGNRGKSGDGGSKGETGPPGSPGYDGHRGPKGPPGVPEQTECKLLEYIRKNCACRGCSDCPNYPLELVVAVDESGGVTSQQWDRMRDLVLRIVREISISESTCPSGAHLAVVSYSSRVKRLIEFSDYHTKKKLLELVQREIIRDSSRGSRKMGEAMMYTARHMFKRVRSGKLVKKMAIFMTTGPPADTENLFSAVLELGVSNIIPVIVTSGQVNIDLLSQAFSDCPGRYEVINNIWEPERIINRLNQCFFCYDACNPDPSCKVGDPACLADMPMDVALLLDSSHGMSSAEFEKARDFLDATVDMFSQPCSTRPRAGARLALVQPRQLSSRKEDPVMVEFDFAQFRLNRTGVKQHIKRSLRQLRSTSSLGLAVEYILGNLFQQQQRTKVIFTILGSGSYQQDRRLAEIALKAKCQGYILFTLVLGRRASNTEIGLLSSPPVSYHSCQVGRVMEPDMDYALRHAKYFFSNLQRRKSDYPPSSLPQCQERGDGSPFEDLLWISDIQSDSSHAQSETDHSQPVYNMETIVQTKNRAGGVYQEEKLQATEPEREETARQNGQQEIQPERENTRENGHLPISEPATEQATEPDNKKLTRADINILKNNPEIKPPTLTRCLLNMDYGRTCKGNQAIRWFYNRNTKSCSIFWYGGCGGNGNRFLTKESCLHHCIPQRPVE